MCGNASTTSDDVAKIISFAITHNNSTDYNFGIAQNILSDDYNLFDAVKWILGHHQENHTFKQSYKSLTNETPFKHRKLNMNYLSQHTLQGYHRSGWNFVMQNLQKLDSPSPSAPIFDSYLDKTFGWDYDFLCKTGFLPYQREWAGVFHHTPNQDYSQHNLTSIFDKPKFIESLGLCKMLIVFSTYLKDWINSKLEYLEINGVQVIMFYHPTQLVDDCLKFSYKKYLYNQHKQVVHIGAWLRNTYDIYELQVPECYQKCALKGKQMDNYFVEDDVVDKIEELLGLVECCGDHQELVSSGGTGCMIPINKKTTNKYILGLIKLIKRNHSSVQILEVLSNEQYDRLLTKNIIFINLVDASAVNTLIECIVRNTPILINRLSATEEYLGCEYPLFYDDLDHATELLADNCNILNAYRYLKKMDKSKFNISKFMQEFVSCEAYRSIQSIQSIE